MLWLVFLLPTMAAKYVWMPFPVKEERRAVERHWFLREVRHVSFFFPSSSPHTHCEIQIWGRQNRVITFDLASFELQMYNLDIWLVRIKGLGGQWRSKFEEVAGRRSYCTQKAVREAVRITTQAKRVSYSSIQNVLCSKINPCCSSF